MDINFKCPHCEQELEVDASGAGSEIQCPACANSLIVPFPEPTVVAEGGGEAAAEPAPEAPKKVEKHFVVPVHATATEALIQRSKAKPLDVIAKEGDKTMRIRTFRRSEHVEGTKDSFDDVVSAYLEKVGQVNIVSVSPISYSYIDASSRQTLISYGVMVVFKG